MTQYIGEPIGFSSAIDTIKEILKIVNKDYYDPWFRGVSISSYQLIPKLGRGKFRTGLNYRDIISEKRAFMLYKKAMRGYHEPTVNSWDIYCDMQHHGLPTRLLDWSENLSIAIYFACIENHNEDGAVWVFSPGTYADAHPNLKGIAVLPDYESLYRTDNIELMEYLDILYEEDNSVLETSDKIYLDEAIKMSQTSFFPALGNSRMNRLKAQSGTFTFHNDLDTPLEEDEIICNEAKLSKYIIKQNHKADILKYLKLLGYAQHGIFPEKQSLANEVLEDLK